MRPASRQGRTLTLHDHRHQRSLGTEPGTAIGGGIKISL
jgi:hypothetical protein